MTGGKTVRRKKVWEDQRHEQKRDNPGGGEHDLRRKGRRGRLGWSKEEALVLF